MNTFVCVALLVGQQTGAVWEFDYLTGKGEISVSIAQDCEFKTITTFVVSGKIQTLPWYFGIRMPMVLNYIGSGEVWRSVHAKASSGTIVFSGHTGDWVEAHPVPRPGMFLDSNGRLAIWTHVSLPIRVQHILVAVDKHGKRIHTLHGQ